MITFKPYATLDAIKTAFNITTGLFIIESNGKVTVCDSDDDAVIVQIGWVNGDGFEIDEALATQADAIYQKMKRYFEGGCHDGISMLVLSFDSEEKNYLLYGDDNDDECEPISLDADNVEELIEKISALV